VRHADDRDVWLGLRDTFPHPYTMADARSWVLAATTALRGRAYAIEVGGFAVGGIGLRGDGDVNRFSAEIGFWLGREYWGRGIATEAVEAMTRVAVEQRGYRRVYAVVFDGNPASARVLEKVGYALEGRLHAHAFKAGRFVDELVYGFVAQ
jgi:RimJ/RimL family protein N-acetyltransferase